ncbi:MAG: protein translocase subunit SecD [Rudaea sp.]|uniref:protein translocase subunit SecD n=1 Tax=unclassified Rudaea TaxID=2627037 RepID=UPI0010F84F92|nr:MULTISPECIES: protein translocase subunit SecD [unclassified Rudaea]MBN8884264.1 protein translocase subunit SecD [Rudaea sp.]MBR0345324.1 protein translocase subunit SecD [Rudaea sp.]
MNDFAKWRYALIAVVLILGTIYALPNTFLPQPAVQVSANRGGTLDDALKTKVKEALDHEKLAVKSLEIGKDNLLVEFNDSDAQNKGQAVISKALGDKYNVALNMASTVPGWLRAIGANAMPLGLDLQGGVHFLLEVDQKGALDKMQQRYRDDISSALRDAKIRFESVNSTPNGIVATFKTEADRAAAGNVIAKQVNQPEKLGDQPPLELTDSAATADNFPILAKVRESTALAAARNTTTSNLTTLRNRVNQLGVSEPIIQQQGANRIVVELAGVHDTAEAKKILQATATLEWRAVDENATGSANLGNPGAYEIAKSGNVPPESKLYYMQRPGPDGKPMPIILSKKVIASGNELVNATAIPDPQSGTPAVSVQLNAKGGQRMLEFTQQNVGKRMGVVYIERVPQTQIVDGKEVRTFKQTEEVINAATIQGVFGSRFQTTGLGQKEASDLALLLRAGSLAAPVDVVEERVIGASLGQDNIDKGFKAVIIGLIAVLFAAAIYYRLFGLIADVALVFNLVLLIAVLSLFQATLTMPGIAGIVLTLGMAIDANVLICERIREEQRNGATPLAAIKAGYEKAWATILDANVTHLLAAVALLFFGSGPIKGFGVTLLVGILTSMFTSVTVTHAIVNLVHSGRKLKALSV